MIAFLFFLLLTSVLLQAVLIFLTVKSSEQLSVVVQMISVVLDAVTKADRVREDVVIRLPEPPVPTQPTQSEELLGMLHEYGGETHE